MPPLKIHPIAAGTDGWRSVRAGPKGRPEWPVLLACEGSAELLKRVSMMAQGLNGVPCADAVGNTPGEDA